MIFFIIVTSFAILMLILGFSGIRIPFFTPRNKKKSGEISEIFDQEIKEKLIKRSIESTFLKTKYPKQDVLDEEIV